MLYCRDEISIFQIHIPRTAGRYIKRLFIDNEFDCYFWDYAQTYKGIEIPHLHYPLYNILEDVEECDNHFTVVRNPYDRFKSIMDLIIVGREYPDEIFELVKNKDWLFQFIDHEKDGNLYKTNFLSLQMNFISEKTKVYKIEDGINENFINWINQNFKLNLVNLEDLSKGYATTTWEDKIINMDIRPSDRFDPIVEKFIKEYYEKDYIKFNYS